MPIAMTAQQERDFEDKGFIILEDFLYQDELDRLLSAICEVADRVRQAKGLPPDATFAVRNALAHHEAFLDLIDHPRILPLVVDAIGWNIQIRTTHLDYRPPYPKGQIESDKLDIKNGPDHKGNYRNTVWHPDLAGDYIFEAPSLDGRLPFMEVKVFYVLSDQSTSNSGNLWLAPGTHDWRKFVRPAELARSLRANGVTVTAMAGASYSPLKDTWSLSRDLSVNYMVVGVKDPAR